MNRRWPRHSAAGLFSALAFLMACDRPTRVVGVEPGTRLVEVSRDVMYWVDERCLLWALQLKHPTGSDSGEYLMKVGEGAECESRKLRIDGDSFYRLSGQGPIVRHKLEQGLLQSRRVGAAGLGKGLALDPRFLYVMECAINPDCRIQRFPKEGGKETLMQAGIASGGRVEVDEDELFWVDYGRLKETCLWADQPTESKRCFAPSAPRIMAAPKEPPRAAERVVVEDFRGSQLFFGPASIYWVGDGAIYRVAKAGGPAQKLLTTADQVWFARFDRDVYLATSEGLFHIKEGSLPQLRYRPSAAPSGLGVDAQYLYWLDPERKAIFKLAR